MNYEKQITYSITCAATLWDLFTYFTCGVCAVSSDRLASLPLFPEEPLSQSTSTLNRITDGWWMNNYFLHILNLRIMDNVSHSCYCLCSLSLNTYFYSHCFILLYLQRYTHSIGNLKKYERNIPECLFNQCIHCLYYVSFLEYLMVLF